MSTLFKRLAKVQTGGDATWTILSGSEFHTLIIYDDSDVPAIYAALHSGLHSVLEWPRVCILTGSANSNSLSQLTPTRLFTIL